MFRSFKPSSLLSILLSITYVIATPSLSTKVDGPSSVSNVNNLKVSVTVSNTGDETLRLLKDPRGPLSTMPANTFLIEQVGSGSKPTFVGLQAKYPKELVAAKGNNDSFVVLQPGGSVSVSHDLSKAYNFVSSGPGDYTIRVNALFHHVDDDRAIILVNTDSQPYTVSLDGVLASSLRSRRGTKQKSAFNGCTSQQQTLLKSAAAAGQAYAQETLNFLQSNPQATTRSTTWFGKYTDTRHATLVTQYSNINSHSFADYTFDCTCTEADTYAFVYPDQFGTVHLCGAFWDAPLTGTDSKGGTLVHESSHFTINAGTQDHVYGETACKSLAKSNPDEAIDNADSHEYMAETA